MKTLTEFFSFKAKKWIFASIDNFIRFIARFRYPISLPEDITKATGIPLKNLMCFERILHKLTNPKCNTVQLRKFMEMEEVCMAFRKAYKKEMFSKNCLFSYYFNEGWIEFKVCFDDDNKLRRVYLHHKSIQSDRGLELPLLH